MPASEAAPAPAAAAEELDVPAAEPEKALFSDGEFSSENDVQQSPDRKVRHSVLAHDPDALRRIVNEDPKVAEAVKLFKGTVIDMHVM